MAGLYEMYIDGLKVGDVFTWLWERFSTMTDLKLTVTWMSQAWG